MRQASRLGLAFGLGLGCSFSGEALGTWPLLVASIFLLLLEISCSRVEVLIVINVSVLCFLSTFIDAASFEGFARFFSRLYSLKLLFFCNLVGSMLNSKLIVLSGFPLLFGTSRHSILKSFKGIVIWLLVFDEL